MGVKSTHLPELAGGLVEVPASGSLIIDTELRDLQSFTCSLVGTISANEESHATWALIEPQAPGTTRKVTLRTYKGGTGSGTAGDTARTVSWIAFGK